MIVSVHLPKTAGSSFLKSLESRFGDGLLRDYTDMAMIQKYLDNQVGVQALINPPDISLSGVQCIHGHFLPLKYIPLASQRDVKFVTWVRDPVDRILSHYYFWKRSYDPKTAGPLFRRVIQEGWSLERFCLSHELQNLYGKYLTGFSLERFVFIGVTEFFAEDLAYFSDCFLGVKLEAHNENVGTMAGGKYQIDSSLRKEIEEFHSKDVELYQAALALRSRRI